MGHNKSYVNIYISILDKMVNPNFDNRGGTGFVLVFY